MNEIDSTMFQPPHFNDSVIEKVSNISQTKENHGKTKENHSKHLFKHHFSFNVSIISFFFISFLLFLLLFFQVFFDNDIHTISTTLFY